VSAISKCMGIMYYKEQCQSCERLPRNAQQEEAEGWMTPTISQGPCEIYRKRTDKAYREEEARKILEEIEARR
jgi:hypothetical protein